MLVILWGNFLSATLLHFSADGLMICYLREWGKDLPTPGAARIHRSGSGPTTSDIRLPHQVTTVS